MSLTYSMHQPNQSLSRTTAIAFIVVLHAAGFIAFNNGLGKILGFSPPPDIKVINVKPDPIPERHIPAPEAPVIDLHQSFHLPTPELGKITIDVDKDVGVVAIPATDIVVGGEPKIIADPIPVSPKLAVVHRVDPAYPTSSERAGEEGTVLVEVQVDANGRAIDVHVARSSGFDALDTAAVRAVKQWRFNHPLTMITVRVPVTFKLSQRF